MTSFEAKEESRYRQRPSLKGRGDAIPRRREHLWQRPNLKGCGEKLLRRGWLPQSRGH